MAPNKPQAQNLEEEKLHAQIEEDETIASLQ